MDKHVYVVYETWYNYDLEECKTVDSIWEDENEAIQYAKSENDKSLYQLIYDIYETDDDDFGDWCENNGKDFDSDKDFEEFIESETLKCRLNDFAVDTLSDYNVSQYEVCEYKLH